MIDESDHIACVDAWLNGAATGLPRERQLELLERGFNALWQRAHRTLGNVTLTAIVDRVLHTASEKFPLLSGLEVDATGMQGLEQLARLRELDARELASATRFVLLEFLTVLGRLTAEVLSPALHAELRQVTSHHQGPNESASHDERPNRTSNDGEGASS